MFSGRFARHSAGRFRRRGLDRTARRIVALLEAQGIDGATVLEVGGGVGDVQIELLRRGAVATTNLELSPAYEEEAARLLDETGLRSRVTRRLVDIATAPDAVGMADIVVLNRVVCCYPDYERLLGAAASRARHQLVFSHPPRNALTRAFTGTQNLALRLVGREFRVFAHPPAAMLAVLEAHGLLPRAVQRGAVWRVVHLTR